jgi:hypothetical protein
VLNHPNTIPAPPAADATPTTPAKNWELEVGQLLARAAELCVDHDIDIDAFVRGAWSAYLEARPGLREYLEEMQLRNQLEELRRTGRMAQA